ncbi:MAG: MoxR family ATPase [Candidatus Cloacimonetes bacterium]|nr:MoxR family ATPase [Candidatus Cloacimonadota bacterium]
MNIFQEHQAPDLEEVLKRLQEFKTRLNSSFVAREQEIDMMIVAAIAQEPILFIGTPGTGKSALIGQFKKLLDISEEDYFEYMLTKFTEPSEIIGPLDLKRLKVGEFHRRVEGKLPTAKLVFLDEVFKSNSAILNTLLTIINERKFYQDGKPHPVPLKVLFGATNEIPTHTELDALKDRFTLKLKVSKVTEDKWDDLLFKGLENDTRKYFNQQQFSDTVFSLDDFEFLHQHIQKSLMTVGETGEDLYFGKNLYMEFKRILKTIIHDFEIEISDRKIIKLYRLIRCHALFKRGGGVEKEDFILLKHLGNQLDEIEFLKEKIQNIL